MLKDFYGSNDTLNISSPSIQKAFYKNNEKKQLVLVFDEGQELVYPEPYKPNDNVTLQMKDFFYLDGQSGAVTSGKAEGNRIILELNASRNEKTLNYLPMYLEEGGPYYPFTGPYLTNKRGMRAFTFYNVPITIGLPVPTLAAELEENGSVKLQWTKIPDAKFYTLERKIKGEDFYTIIGTFTDPETEFVDESAPTNTEISYRIKSHSETSESADYSYAEVEAQLVLGTEINAESFFSVFPNPAVKNQPVTIRFNKAVTGKISVINHRGQYLSDENINQQKEIHIIAPDKTSGYHFIRFDAAGQVWSKKLMVR
jgi:hypothetical protein